MVSGFCMARIEGKSINMKGGKYSSIVSFRGCSNIGSFPHLVDLKYAK